MSRSVEWEGFYNARDLGGLRTVDGARTGRGALVRSADLRFVTSAGWRSALHEGIRTVVDLRRADEASAVVDRTAAPPRVDVVRVALDDVPEGGTPLCYRAFLDSKPEQCAMAVAAIARAAPGGVIFHCGAGRDRTGLVAALVLGLVGVQGASIAEDYELSAGRLGAFFSLLGRKDPAQAVEAELRRRQVTARALVMEMISGSDLVTALRAGGLERGDIDMLRERAVEEDRDDVD